MYNDLLNCIDIRKTYKKVVVFSKCLLHLDVIRVLSCSVCWFLYGTFCHGALKLDISTLFTTFCL